MTQTVESPSAVLPGWGRPHTAHGGAGADLRSFAPHGQQKGPPPGLLRATLPRKQDRRVTHLAPAVCRARLQISPDPSSHLGPRPLMSVRFCSELPPRTRKPANGWDFAGAGNMAIRGT